MIDPVATINALLDHPLITLQTNHDVPAVPVSGFTHTVIATANAARNFDNTLPLSPLRGQMVTLRATPASMTLAQVICHKGYITPAIDGLHYAGATFQKEAPVNDHDHRDQTRTDDNAEILATLQKHLPHLGLTPGNVVAARATYRATTPDKLPLIGVLDQERHIYISAGFGAHGFTAAPLAGDIIASHICGDPMPVPADLLPELSPDRFARRGRTYKSITN